MKKLVATVFRLYTGKSDAELSKIWEWNYFLTRSRLKAYLSLL